MGGTDSAPNACFAELQDLFADPADGARVRFDGARFASTSGAGYGVEGNIADFYVPEEAATNRVTDEVKVFYEEKPFPNYDDIDNREMLRQKARRTVFAEMLDAQLPAGARVLEAGCGTGQLTNFLAMSPHRRVVGGDLSVASLRLAERFRGRFGINNAAFVRMNIFRLPFRPGAFDVIISNGVLHHTRDARAAFGKLVEKLKPGGLIVIGLYNTYARIPTLARRMLARRSRSLAVAFDAHLRKLEPGSPKFEAWFADQYLHPAETRHSQGDVLAWFDENGVEFLSGIPAPDGKPFRPGERLFEPHGRSDPLRRTLSQLAMLLENPGDGGLFVMIGRRK